MKAASSAFGKPREVICFAGLFCICKKTKNFSSEPSREAVDAACFATIAVHINGRLFIGRPLTWGRIMLVVGFTGHSGSGKTTLIEKVLEALISRDRKVSAIKSSHHGTDIDVPGKDSYRFRQAGAQEVVLVSDQRWALMRETEEPVSLKEILSRLSPVDIVLVEGYKSEENIPHILVHRKDAGLQAPVLTSSVVAVATDDDSLALPEGIAKLDVNNPVAVANFVVSLKANRDHL